MRHAPIERPFSRILPRLLLVFSLLSPLPLAGLAWLHLTAFERALHETVLTNLTSIADKKADEINDYLDERLANSRLLAKTAITRQALRALSALRGDTTSAAYHATSALHRDYFRTLFDSAAYHDLLLIDANGNVVFSIKEETDLGTNLNSGPFRDTHLAQAHREAMALLDSQTTHAGRYGPSGNEPAIFFVTPVFERGVLLGTVALQLDLERLTAVTTDLTGLGETGEAVLAQREGDSALYVGPLHHVSNAAFHHRIPLDQVAAPMRNALQGNHGRGVTQDYAQIEIIGAWRHLPVLGWGMVVKMDTAEAYAPIRQLRKYSLGALAALLLLAGAVALLFGRSLIRPIRRLTSATQHLAAGDLRVRAPVDGCGEFRELAESFNRMADQLGEEQSRLEERVRERTRELQERDATLNRAQAVAKIGSWMLDVSRRRVTWSEETYRIFGIKKGTPLSYENFLACIHPDDRAAVDRAWQAARRGGRFDIIHRIGNDDGIRWVREQAELNFAADGRLLIGIGTVQDVTSEKLTEADLIEAKQAAETANRAKSEFLANMSHEIRTPMNAILGLTQLVLESPLEARQKDFLQKALDSGRALLGILNDILDYSKIEAERMDIEHQPFSVEQTLRDVADLFSAHIEEKGLEFHLDIAPDLPAQVQGDAMRLSQVLNNLVGNAVKFTERGAIRVSADVAQTNADDMMLRFTIKDTGIGIHRDNIGHLFAAFTQADSSVTRRYGGTGLGLAICHKLVHLMGGEIAASGAEGQGATFTFTLRVGRSPRAHNSAPESAPRAAMAGDRQCASSAPATQKSALAGRRFDGARVLLAEDNPTNRIVAAEFLKRRGILVTLASDGREALAAITDTPEPGFDAVLMDLHMPVMDGLDATRRIRELPQGATIPIIAMTAAVLNEDRERCRAAGMTDFVPKPIDPDELTRTLANYLRADNAPPASAPPMPASVLPGQLPGFDLPAALERLYGDHELLLELLQGFASNLAAVPTEIESLLAGNRLPELKKRVHSLKGVAGNLGATRLFHAALHMEEQLLKEDRDTTELLAAITATRAGIRRLAAAAPAGTPPAATDAAAIRRLLDELRPFLEERELLPDALLQRLRQQCRADLPGTPLTHLAWQIDQFDHDGALLTVANIAAQLGPDPHSRP